MGSSVDLSDERQAYFSDAIEKIVENGNTGYLPAFFNSLVNEEGISFTLENFKKIMDENDVLCNWKILPSEFVVTVRYSPIAFFKKWILHVSNRPLIKVSEYNTPKMFEREFFFLFIKNQIYLFSVINNLSHERFLYRLYFRPSFKEKNIMFSTYFNEHKKLIVYKDYYKRKVSTIPFPGKNFIKNKLYPVRVSVIKDDTSIRYMIYMNEHKINHAVKIRKTADSVFQKNSERVVGNINQDTEDIKGRKIRGRKKKDLKSNEGKSLLVDYRREVVSILSKNHQKEFETNKFANVSLGRIYSVPILINLSQKYKNIKIKILFKSKEEVLQVYHQEGQLIKIFSISFSPKSNWLERA